MDELEMYKGILDSYPYPIVFVDNDYIIRFMNQYAKYHYYQQRNYDNLIGKSLFLCHNEKSKAKIMAAYEGIKNNGKPVFIGVSTNNLRIYMQGVKNDHHEWIGFFERFELNQCL